MNWKHASNDLPDELNQALRGLGVSRAPAELWDRVALTRQELVPAPPALRQRVEAELFPARVAAHRRGRVLVFSRAFSAAAALLLLLGGGVLLWSASGLPRASATGPGPRAALHAYHRSTTSVGRVEPDQLSAAARSLAERVGVPTAG